MSQGNSIGSDDRISRFAKVTTANRRHRRHKLWRRRAEDRSAHAGSALARCGGTASRVGSAQSMACVAHDGSRARPECRPLRLVIRGRLRPALIADEETLRRLKPDLITLSQIETGGSVVTAQAAAPDDSGYDYALRRTTCERPHPRPRDKHAQRGVASEPITPPRSGGIAAWATVAGIYAPQRGKHEPRTAKRGNVYQRTQPAPPVYSGSCQRPQYRVTFAVQAKGGDVGGR
jgi:hypothetical protein